ncbi:MAG: YebC/PmpR family DNA-binding transcriptional regulator [Syntrophobacteria bacterium]|jgi:YebC/PmpR family DNA-binding regulatory protein|nr:YebC/PmpR family DNA-binding transcriptional regulator [Deltaproteobacteria bacterium]MDH3852807.1 YebC/PmpR family DNA-binding transcriptional regulator [Deltaproteobacteria bacterium]MDH3899389.1 YebC/PmpR family DNA-binding transcriptional regulator [Deltaproteobacteria bacterium]MDH3951211.1 YebC/PmpR family DNA-binding transcriptional regulator [Deltaproteobacteria bacterium]PNV85641.1 MAG: YebC/PmpR family DNA-binding transcriptional regulator [Desulfobacteraceae bacterium]
MSGHSKWHSIRHKKGATDVKRGKIFSRINKELMVAARMGGGDPSANPRLRQAIASAKAENMPKDNIERAIKKGTGELEGVNYEEHVYEGYAPGGVALLIEVMTDNKNRAAADIRYVFNKRGGSLGEAGCVAWMFDKKGLIVFEQELVDEDKILEVALEAGADDVITTEDQYEVHTELASFESVKQAFDDQELQYTMAEITMMPQNTVQVDDEAQAAQVLKLMDAIEDADDVQKVYANFDIPDEILQRIT